MSVVVVAVALVVSLPVGLAIGHTGRGAVIGVNLANIGRAIPSFAILVMGAEVLGIGAQPAFLALLALAIPPIVTNTSVAIREVDPDAREAARGMGLTARQMLFRVEIPLAVPAIIAGVRVATVTIISLATVAAFVVDEGLGAPIFAALQSSFNTEFIAAGALAVLLALLADALLVGVQRLVTPWARAGGAR